MVEISNEKSLDLLNIYIQDELKTKILNCFPSFYPFSFGKREEILDTVIKEIQTFIEKYKDDKRYFDFISNKIKPFIYLNPHYHVSMRFLALLKNVCCENDISKFYDNETIVSIQDLAYFFEKNEKKSNFPLPKTLKTEEYYSLLNDIANFNNGKITHLERLLCWFPDYLSLNFQTKNTLMINSGPLPIDWRFYIAIMAVSCYGSKYLYNHLSILFLNYGGDPEWLQKGINCAPIKIQNLKEINAIMAYRPWALGNTNFIKDNLKGKDQWTIAELMHGMMIFAYFHSWACFCFANGIRLESDMNLDKNDLFERKISFEEKSSPLGHHAEYKNEEIISLLKKMEEDKKGENISHYEGVNASEKKKTDKIAFSCPNEDFLFEADSQQKDNLLQENFRQFISENVEIEDFNYHKFSILHSHDYNLNTHGIAILNEFMPEFANDFQKEIDYIYKMTDMTFENKKNVNSEPFRRAIKYYTENIFGYFHDHYEYKQVNLLMPREFKTFIKKIATKPFEINQFNSNNIKIKLFPSEKCHVSLLTIITKFQIEVIYSLEGIGKSLYDKQ